MRPMNGVTLYRGPSELDGKPIIVVATGLRRQSKNSKTGNMIQTWILREDISPLQAISAGQDVSICGTCPSRSKASGGDSGCYVTVAQAPQAVYRAYHRGAYPMIAGDQWRLFNGRAVRFGAYGDPAAAPADLWRRLTSYAASWTGYTHQWRTRAELRAVVMASVDSRIEQTRAALEGWRTFRVRTAGEPMVPKEITCPASEESGYRTTCEQCTLCAGASRQAANIAILAHGSTAKVFALRVV